MPQLQTALNTPELARQASFMMLLMGTKLADVNQPVLQTSEHALLDEHLMGQAVIKLADLTFQNDTFYLVQSIEVMIGNFRVAEAMLKLRYDSVRN